MASVATGCSSDASRFSGLFSDTDNVTTASVPQRQIGGAYGRAPTPRGDLNNGGQYAAQVPQTDYGSSNSAMNQPYPGNSNNSGGYASPARVASAPVAVQRSELAAPSSSMAQPRSSEPASRQEAMAQPFPGRATSAPSMGAQASNTRGADNVVTGTVKSTSGWSTVNAPQVTMRPGETAATLSKRYGVPEKEILKANGGSLAVGQSVTIPTFGPSRNSAKVASGDIDLQNRGPNPTSQQEQKLAVLPSAAGRDKAQGDVAKLTPPSGGKPVPAGDTYTVKSGDTLNKISRATGVPIGQLKAANGLTTEGVRIGQTLKLSGAAAADPVRTASIPQTQEKPQAPKPVVAAAPVQAEAPAAPAKPVATASVSDAETKSDVTSAAPQSTGISKYRWPVNGAVIAGYGQNVNGSRSDGIDISVPEGTPIKAAENGVVIYSGNGLKQLGNTVLVRHDDGKVTVYGHAGALNVSRGQKVTRGQTLGSSGMSGDAKRPQVHFEVRKDATPINPITFLE